MEMSRQELQKIIPTLISCGKKIYIYRSGDVFLKVNMANASGGEC